MATRQELFEMTYGRQPTARSGGLLGGGGTGFGSPASSAFDWDMWRRDPSRNPNLWEATADDEAMAWTGLQNQLEHQLLMEENARRAKNRVGELRGAIAQPAFNLFEAPTNPGEAEIQKLIQAHVNAGIRGFDVGFKGDLANRARAIENLKLRQSLQGDSLDRAKFGLEQRKFRDDQKNDEFRRQYQTALLGQSQQRFLADQQDDVYRALDNDSKMAFEMIRDYGMDPEEAIRVFGIPRGSAQDVLRSVGTLNQKQDANADAEFKNYADILNQIELQNRRSRALDVNESDRAGLRRGDPRLPAMDPAMFLELGRDAAKGGLSYDPGLGFLRVPQRSQSQLPAVRYNAEPSQPVARSGPPTIRTFEEAFRLPPNIQFFRDPTGRIRRNPNYRR